MAFDFPSSPTVGQQFSPVAGTTYTYNGYGWTLPVGASGGGPLAVRVFVSSGTYTPTVGTAMAVVECVGGGGGGGAVVGGSGQAHGGGGGGSGGYSRRLLTAAQIGASQTVTIGAAGAGSTLATAPGGNGGDTSLSTLCVAKGGIGGTSNNAGAPFPVPGGAGGSTTGAVGDVVAAGSPGAGGSYAVGTTGVLGQGGSGPFGGGAPTVVATAGNGNPASNYGSGGSGAFANNTVSGFVGGNGSPGIVIVTEFGPATNTALTTTTKIVPFLSGSGTYTPSPGTVAFIVDLVGGGAGGAGGNNGGAGTAGGNTTFDSLTATGGAATSNYAVPSAPGVGSGGNVYNLSGGWGGVGTAAQTGAINGSGGMGGATIFGGAGGGVYGAAGDNAQPNTGAGGGGGGTGASSPVLGGVGGSSGGAVRHYVTSPAASYSYSVGTGGTGGSTGVNQGGNGGSGAIYVTEFIAIGVTTATSINRKVLTTSQTYVPSPNLMAADIECVGGGGGAGSAANTANFIGSGGGGAGGYSRKSLTAAQIGASQTVTIGAAGNGGAAGSNNGTAGGDTSFGSLCIAKGGAGSVFGLTSGNGNLGGAGGSITGAVGDVVAAGSPGDSSATTAQVTWQPAGTGGSSVFGGGGLGAASNADGSAASNYGGGGGGASSGASAGAHAGGNGSAGVCIITEYIAAVPPPPSVPAGTLVLIQRVDVASAVATVDFTSGIDATYEEYEVHFMGWTNSVDGPLGFRVSLDGGATWKSGASDYTYGASNILASGSFTGGNIAYGQIASNHISAATLAANGIVRFANPSKTNARKPFLTECSAHGTTYFRVSGFSTYNIDNSAINGLRFLNLNGNITGGTFILYGIKR